jgi:hypothetical protein
MSFGLGFWAAAGAGGSGASSSFELISTAFGTGSSSIITFSSIPSTYKHLQIRMVARGTSNYNGYLKINFNSDTATNYSWHALNGGDNGSNVLSQAGSSSSSILRNNYNDDIPSALNTSDAYGPGIVDILDYVSTTNYKTIRQFYGKNSDYGYIVGLSSGSWRSTSAITSITLTGTDLGNFTTASRFSLFGIRG